MVHLTMVLEEFAHRKQRINMVRVTLQELSNGVWVVRPLQKFEFFLQLSQIYEKHVATVNIIENTTPAANVYHNLLVSHRPRDLKVVA